LAGSGFGRRALSGLGLSGLGLSGLGSSVAFSSRARAQSAPDTIELWPSAPPGDTGSRGAEHVSTKGSVTNISSPRLNVFRPDHARGTAMVVVAGGGYAHIEAGTESTPCCQWLRSFGVTAFELIYRLPEDGWPPTAPFQDGQRAMRLVRAAASRYAINPARIGIVGFSAGGHLAGMTSVRPDARLYPPVDASDAQPARPDFAALLYPVISMMPPLDHTHARREILGEHPTPVESEAYSVERLVTPATPPMFLAQAMDDPIAPVQNSELMFDALRPVQKTSELHVFQSGGHGWGMGKPGTEPGAWPEMFINWASRNGFFPAAG